jgi:hypothetical protein
MLRRGSLEGRAATGGRYRRIVARKRLIPSGFS